MRRRRDSHAVRSKLTGLAVMAGVLMMALLAAGCQSDSESVSGPPTAEATTVEAAGAATATPASAPATATPGPTIAPTATTPPAPTATAVAAPTATPAATPTAGGSDDPAYPQFQMGARYGVVRIPPNDPDGGLVMHEDPLVASPTVTVLDESTSNAFAEDVDGNWWFVSVGNFGGWVDSYYLTPLASDLPCSSDPSDYNEVLGSINPPPTAMIGVLPEFLAGIHRYQVDGCQRVVLTFGAEDANFAEGTFATSAPGAVGSGLAIHDIWFTPPVAGEQTEALSGGVPWAFYVNDYDEAAGVAIHNDQNRTGRVIWRTSPGQIVIDSISAPTGTGLDLGPQLPDPSPDNVGSTVFRSPFNEDLGGRAPYIFRMSGYARPFEANFAAWVERDGTPVDVSFVVSDPVTGVEQSFSGADPVPVGTTNWTTGWGRFAFTLSIPTSEPPGLYVLRTEEGAVEGGLSFTFCVGAVPAQNCT